MRPASFRRMQQQQQHHSNNHDGSTPTGVAAVNHRRLSTNDAAAWALLHGGGCGGGCGCGGCGGRAPLRPLEEGREVLNFGGGRHHPRCLGLRRKISDGWLGDGETIKVFRPSSKRGEVLGVFASVAAAVVPAAAIVVNVAVFSPAAVNVYFSY